MNAQYSGLIDSRVERYMIVSCLIAMWEKLENGARELSHKNCEDTCKVEKKPDQWVCPKLKHRLRNIVKETSK